MVLALNIQSRRYKKRTYQSVISVIKQSQSLEKLCEMQKILLQMAQSSVTHAIMEVSSHAVDLYRIKACRFNVGVFTNLTQDHLDYHKDMKAYWNCKKAFFTDYLSTDFNTEPAIAILNLNDSRGRELAAILPYRCITVGHDSDAVIQPLETHQGPDGIQGRVITPSGPLTFASALTGGHNLENILCAVGVGVAYGLAPETISKGIEELNRVPGRLEKIPDADGRHIYVDYAHTPDALKNVLQALRAMSSRRILCVFGCGGDRDPDKRPQMGTVAAELCDLAIITSDNPRSENPSAIIDQILPGVALLQGCRYAAEDLKTGFDKKGFTIEPDRRHAIELAIRVSEPDDAVLIAGKGHETYQILADKTIDFDDRQEARRALVQLEA